MTEKDFVAPNYLIGKDEGTIIWNAPSNIALVKYWGKKAHQIPANPSLSFTLETCATNTKLNYRSLEVKAADFSFEILLNGKPKKDFRAKIQTFFARIEPYLPFLKAYHFIIDTTNTFPHSSGIASSASGMAALALCLVSLERKLNAEVSEEFGLLKASFLARLGSGSASRSIEGELVHWGVHSQIPGSSDLYAIKAPFKVHPVFKKYQDTVLLIEKGQKKVSSSAGHKLMHQHPFAKQRFKQAHDHINQLREIFSAGDLEGFIKIVELEALTLHAMMMTSMPYYILMKPNTLEVIERIWRFREATQLHLCFTLDAGANVHVLYPEHQKAAVLQFIKNELIAFCENRQYICDQIGFGARKM